jgi:O-acetyl-ADP-ribose deacetylase (regulator of RNase III)
MRISITADDITTLAVDAIVNAANESLAPGGGVCGAIHRAAGPGLAAECAAIGHCATGDVALTGGYGLPAKCVIHAVGPVWQGREAGEDDRLAKCYRRAVEVAREEGLRTIAFPAISCGIFGFPAGRAARIALSVLAEAGDHAELERLILTCPDPGVRRAYEEAAEELGIAADRSG